MDSNSIPGSLNVCFIMGISDTDYLKKVSLHLDGVGYRDILNFAEPPLTRTEVIMSALKLNERGFVTLTWSNDPELGNIPTVRITEKGRLIIS